MLDFQKRQREQARVYSRDKVYAGGSPNFNERTGQYTNPVGNQPLLHIQPMPPNFQQVPQPAPVAGPISVSTQPVNFPTNYQRTISAQPIGFPGISDPNSTQSSQSSANGPANGLKNMFQAMVGAQQQPWKDWRQGSPLAALLAALEQRKRAY
ncbi:MAG: hypothetical protein PHW65_03915 [Dehalococcoidales bacterium]|nr:hypothetical protein [Dehalococcoidales bacterium]